MFGIRKTNELRLTMRTFAEKPKAPHQAPPAKSTIPGRAHVGQSHEVNSILRLQRTIGNQAMQRLLQAHAAEFAVGSATTASTRLGHAFSRIRVLPPAAGSIQTNLAINKPEDEYEQETDHVTEQMMRMPEPQLQRDSACGECSKSQAEQPGQEHDRLQTKRVESSDSEPTAVPPTVHEVVGSPGQPLDAATRAFMEPRFGHHFSQVRVHTDAKAVESARDVNASAYTVGRNIVFGAGQFLPGTRGGLQLLSHELTHVVQQRRSSNPVAGSVGAPGDFHERQAGAVADALMRGGDVGGLLNSGSGPTCPALQRQPAPQPPIYYRELLTVAAVTPGQTAANVRTFLNGKVRSGDITSFAVAGVRAGSQPEIFVLALLHGMAKRTNWNMEADIVTAIGWPARAGGLAPQGLITVRIDQRGAATAELIGAGPPAVAQVNFADAEKKLEGDFGITSVTGWSGTNPTKDAAEISDVLAALDLLKSRAPQDVAALKGVELIRVASLPGGRGGEFFAGSQVALGQAADVKPYLKLADPAFEANKSLFAGGSPGSPTVPGSFQTILHEVGHALETEQLRVARENVIKAKGELEAARKVSQGDPAKFDAELKEARKKGKRAEDEFYKKQAAELKKNEEAQEKAFKREQEEKDKFEKTKVPGSGRTRRLQKFVDFVNANKIARFTKYAAQNWPNNPEEFYAEAYSLWLVDPAFLSTNYKVVYDFFQDGDYLK